MIKVRHPSTLGHLKEDWIESYRSFSNNSYYDPGYIHYSDLEVINDDRVQPGNLVPIHQHCDMEILGYIVDGGCYHNDNLHNTGIVPAGCVQRMSSGTGIWHTEGNIGDTPIRYLQIWLRPNRHNFPPAWDAVEFTVADKLNRFTKIASQSGPITIHSDASVYAGVFTAGYTHKLAPDRRHYLYVVSGTATVANHAVGELWGMTIEGETELVISNPINCEILLFDLR